MCIFHRKENSCSTLTCSAHGLRRKCARSHTHHDEQQKCTNTLQDVCPSVTPKSHMIKHALLAASLSVSPRRPYSATEHAPSLVDRTRSKLHGRQVLKSSSQSFLMKHNMSCISITYSVTQGYCDTTRQLRGAGAYPVFINACL